jgi:hypothetical protein
MNPKRKETTDRDLSTAQSEIERLIASPPVRRNSDACRFHESDAASSPMAKQAVDQMRRKLAADRGLTYEQWLAMEDSVSHPRDIVPVTVTPRMMARRRMKAAGVPELFIEHTADRDPVDCEPMRAVRGFLSSKDGFHVLSGGKGTRKSGSASWSLGQLDGGAFLEASEIIRLSITPDRQRWDEILLAPLVVLDDLGTEKRDEKGAFTSALSELINKVYSNRRRLIITCNLTKETFKTVYGAREFDRMREMGKWSSIAGESVRSYRQQAMGDQ